MKTYAVCLGEDVNDSKLISVVKSSSEKEALRYHFRRYALTTDYFKEFVVGTSSDDLFCSYFIEGSTNSEEQWKRQWKDGLQRAKEVLSEETVKFLDFAFHYSTKNNKNLSEVPDTILVDVADFIVDKEFDSKEIDRTSFIYDAIIVEIDEIPVID